MVSLFSQIRNQSFKHMLIGTFIVFISSCISTYQLPSPTVSRYFNEGSINQAITIHEQNNLNYIPDSHDQVLYGLDMGMLNHYAGNYRLSNDFLTQAERAIEQNFTRSLSRYLSSFILDDRSLDYCGEDYEDIYLNIFKALNYYNLNQPESAMVEIRRVNEKLILLKDKYNQVERRLNRSQEAKKIKKRMTLPSIQFHNSALSRYLSALFYRYEKDYDSVRIDIEHLYDAFHNQSVVYNYTMPKEIFMQYQCLQSPFPDTCFQSSGNATVRIIAFVGQSPQKKARTYWIISRKNHLVIARNKNGSQQLDLIPWKGIQSGYTFKFSVPYLKRRPHSVHQIECIIDNQRFKLSKLEDISNVAIDTFNRKKRSFI
ncbi:MAG: hypothetical protein OMM_01212 [Candidatus Magnetoglobus multicellularis str. Araruama]|uniref:Uncharacterized protein n=1 Tax=Candidatus Magnetoglobus multicellularis str. Araruama TaxID=890399 RepID=A0A1V1PEA0_9BACT|nr:MAG: hypothetical protein OMM_01212 [Candidatus Magnetoglobus multicellularis str. Araruama]